jgi:peptide/nickel transport system permease protein
MPAAEKGILRQLNPSESPWQRRLRALRRNKVAMLGLGIIVFWALVATVCPLIAPYGYIEQEVTNRLKPPSTEHWFGTDELGRDVFSRVVYGARISLPIGFIVIVFAVIVGTVIGASAGYIGGAYDLTIMRLADIMAFPSSAFGYAAVGPSLINADRHGVGVVAGSADAEPGGVKNGDYVTSQ